jgi:hypothetical protein
MIWKSRLSLKKKLGIATLLGGGLLTTVAGLLRCILILTSGAQGPEQAGEWSCRESFLAVLVSNVPFLFPAGRRAFKKLTSQSLTEDEYSRSRSFGLHSLKSAQKKKFKHPLSIPDDTIYERYDSKENIVSPTKNLEAIHENHSHDSGGNEIRVAAEWDVENSHVHKA